MLKVDQKNVYLLRPTESWQALIDNDLAIVYANNSELIDIGNDYISIADPEDYLLKTSNALNKSNAQASLANMLGLRQGIEKELEKFKKVTKGEINALSKEIEHFPITDLKEYNLLSSLLNELKNHEVEHCGKKYYLIEHLIKSELKKDIEEFYGKNDDLIDLINEVNYKAEFSYGCMIDSQSLRYEIVFNRLFAHYDFNLNKLIINPLGTVLANALKKSKEENKPKFSPPPPRAPPSYYSPFGGSPGLIRYAAIRKDKK